MNKYLKEFLAIRRLSFFDRIFLRYRQEYLLSMIQFYEQKRIQRQTPKGNTKA